MKILWLTTQFPNGNLNRNGMFVFRTVQELSNEYDITVIALHPVIPPLIPMLKNIKSAKSIYKEWRERYPKDPVPPNDLGKIKVRYIKFIRPPRIKNNFFEGWFVYRAVRKYIKREKNNITLIHATWLFPEGYAANLIYKKYKIPFIVTLMGSDINLLQTGNKKWEYAQEIFNNSIKVTSVASSLFIAAEEKNLKLAEEKKAITHTIYETEKFVMKDISGLRKNYNFGIDKKIIFFAGALRKIKNADVLIKAFAMLNREKFHLLIAGAGFEEANLKDLVRRLKLEDEVKFLGNLNSEKMIDFYNLSDVFCLPSKNEGMPNVVVESLLCGTPVVASRVAEIPFMIKEGETGYLVEPNSAEDLAEKLEMSLNNDWDREKIRASMAHLSKENIVAQYRKVYGEVLKKSPLERACPDLAGG